MLECGTLITSVERVGMLFRFVQPLVAEPAGQVQAEDLDDEVGEVCKRVAQERKSSLRCCSAGQEITLKIRSQSDIAQIWVFAAHSQEPSFVCGDRAGQRQAVNVDKRSGCVTAGAG